MRPATAACTAWDEGHASAFETAFKAGLYRVRESGAYEQPGRNAKKMGCRQQAATLPAGGCIRPLTPADWRTHLQSDCTLRGPSAARRPSPPLVS